MSVCYLTVQLLKMCIPNWNGNVEKIPDFRSGRLILNKSLIEADPRRFEESFLQYANTAQFNIRCYPLDV